MVPGPGDRPDGSRFPNRARRLAPVFMAPVPPDPGEPLFKEFAAAIQPTEFAPGKFFGARRARRSTIASSCRRADAPRRRTWTSLTLRITNWLGEVLIVFGMRRLELDRAIEGKGGPSRNSRYAFSRTATHEYGSGLADRLDQVRSDDQNALMDFANSEFACMVIVANIRTVARRASQPFPCRYMRACRPGVIRGIRHCDYASPLRG
jgi:hypothetical protein